jgi:hypothetical protein
MPAPTYIWEFNSDLFGDRIPKVVTLEATSGIYTKIGTLMSMASGQALPSTDGNTSGVIGISMEENAVAMTGADPIKIAVIAPGMVIKGTAVDTAASVSGFTSKVIDLDSDGRLDPDDVTGGGLTVLRTEDSGLTVYCLVTLGAIVG